MTKEEKELLLKDLCARLPYGVKGKTLGSQTCTLHYIGKDGSITADAYHCWIENKQFIPYLRPLSSMTEEERLELSKLSNDKFKFYLYTKEPEIICYEKYNYLEGLKVLNWLNAHHFDYRGLIEKGLALEAPEGMYKI